jgi:predicted GIY-YIG superfamily endonuclease
MAKDIKKITDIVKQAFLETHKGYSTDEVIICDKLNSAFIENCKKQLPSVSDEAFNRRLLSLRKQGKFGRVAIKQDRNNHDDYYHASEIAARLIYDKYHTTTDSAFCKPELKKEFDSIAQSIAPNVHVYLLRKAALKLRKNRQLRPEIVPRVASWHKRVLKFSVEDVARNPTLIPRQPGIYIFWDASGYLYIGESEDIYSRVKKHLDHSDRKSLAHYFWENGFTNISIELHVFDPNSDAVRKISRQAYESNLIEVRQPKFNVRP